jgi:hypothetical protein
LSEGSPRSLFQCHCMGKNPASIHGRFCQSTSTTAKWKFQGKQTELRNMFYLALQYHRPWTRILNNDIWTASINGYQ